MAPEVVVERTWGEAAVEYVLDLERRGKATDRAQLDINYLLPLLDPLPLSHVHQRTLQPWIDAQRGRLTSGTVARALRTCAAVLAYAARVLRDDNRPWLATAPPRLVAPDWGTRQPVRLTWDEQDRLVEALPTHLRAPVLFALYTGARQGEITSLTWEQHTPTPPLPTYSVWYIPPEKRKGNARRAASQQQGRYLVCGAAARAALPPEPDARTGVVFRSPRGGALFRINNHGWKSACRHAGVTLRVHDLRHTFGERLASAGVPFDVRKTLLGHHHGDITAHYSTPGLASLLGWVEGIWQESV